MTAHDVIDYDELVAGYNDNLATVLRGFRPTASAFETWVPDEDHVKSLLNLIEAADVAGVRELRVFVGAETARQLDVSRLLHLVSQLGSVEVKPHSGGLTVHVAGIGGPVEPHGPRGSLDAAHPAYRDRISAAARTATHERPPSHEPSGVSLEIRLSSGLVGVVVDPATDRVAAAWHWNAASETERGILETLCRVVVDTPMQEVSDHAAIYVESTLRDRDQSPPVPGIVSPDNSDRWFATVLRATRDLARRYRELTGKEPEENLFQRETGPAWAKADPQERVRLVQGAMESLSREMGFGQAPRTVRVDDDTKVTVEFETHLAPAVAQHRLMRLERGLQARVEPALQLYLEELKDKNVIRKIVPPKEMSSVGND